MKIKRTPNQSYMYAVVLSARAHGSIMSLQGAKSLAKQRLAQNLSRRADTSQAIKGIIYFD